LRRECPGAHGSSGLKRAQIRSAGCGAGFFSAVTFRELRESDALGRFSQLGGGSRRPGCSAGFAGGGRRGSRWSKPMKKNRGDGPRIFGRANDRNDNQKHSGNRKRHSSGEQELALGAFLRLRTVAGRAWRLLARAGSNAGDLQFCRRDSPELWKAVRPKEKWSVPQQRQRQRRRRELRRAAIFWNGPAPPGVAAGARDARYREEAGEGYQGPIGSAWLSRLQCGYVLA